MVNFINMKNKRQGNHNDYFISLHESRSVIALLCGILVFCLTFLAVFQGITKDTDGTIFHYFTVLSNLFSATGAAFMIPDAVEGIRQKRFMLPRWIVMFQFTGALGVAITFLTTLVLILPVEGANAVTGMNFWLHLVTPLLTITLFQCVETGVSLTKRDMLMCLVPYWAYMFLYFIMVVVIGEERGGWADIYYTQAFWPAWVSAILMFALGLAVALLLRRIQNYRSKQARSRITRLWAENIDPVELKIEAFGLGRFMGSHGDRYEMHIPVDIFEMMSEKYDISVYELSKAYIKGMADGLDQTKKPPASD